MSPKLIWQSKLVAYHTQNYTSGLLYTGTEYNDILSVVAYDTQGIYQWLILQWFNRTCYLWLHYYSLVVS